MNLLKLSRCRKVPLLMSSSMPVFEEVEAWPVAGTEGSGHGVLLLRRRCRGRQGCRG